MAIAPTGAIYKSLFFDGEDSRSYGVYITGEAVYNAPERDVEMIEIPGRNGAFALDNGRFQNIEVAYPTGIFASTEADFRTAVSNFRNFLCSKRGYVRLTDEYNPDEYRLAVYKSGLEVSPTMLKAGEFEIVFDCKPQRFLTSGETAVTVANNGRLTNPTLFPSNPLLRVDGYGDITINGETMNIDNAFVGNIPVTSGTKEETSTSSLTTTLTVDIDSGEYNNGDILSSLNNNLFTISLSAQPVSPGKYGGFSIGSWYINNSNAMVIGTSSSGSTSRSAGPYTVINASNTSLGTYTCNISVSYSYNGSRTITCTVTCSFSGTGAQYMKIQNTSIKMSRLYVDSTVRSVSNTMYIDLDLGEAWSESAGVITPLNNVLAVGAKLPTLNPGTNTFTYDNTITALKVTPRWWKV